MLSALISLLGILITLLLVVGIHELGHFVVAKSLKIKVLRFSIGFGKALKTWHDKSGTEYVLAAIPLGGYVKMLDESEGTVLPSEKHLSYNQQPFYCKMAVIIAGPLMNLVFAFFLYWILFVVGFVTVAPVIGSIQPNSIAFQAGMKPNQEITAIDQRSTSNWTAVLIDMIERSGDANQIQFTTKDLSTHTVQTYKLDLAHWHLNELKPDPLDSLGIVPYEPIIPAIIGTIQPDSPAIRSKLLIGDKIIAINKQPIKDWHALTEVLHAHGGETMNFTILRQDKTFILPVTMSVKTSWFFSKQAYLGVSPAFEWPSNLLRKNQYNPIAALGHAYQDVARFTQLNFLIVEKMLTGKMSLKSLGGPITIFQSAGQALNQGIVSFMSFLAFLSISIGIMNILPIPGLDGGHLLFQSIEALIKRPIPDKIIAFFYRFGLLFILFIMVQALFNDISRIAGS